MTSVFAPARNRAAVWACYVSMMCIAIATTLAPIFLTTFASDFRRDGALLSEAERGLIPSAVMAGLVAGIALSGPLADRLGGKRFAMIGLGLVSAGLLATAAAMTYGMLLASSFLMGLGAGVLDMVMSPIVAALRPDRKTSAMNWLHSFYCLGAVIVTAAGWWVIRIFEPVVPWRAFAAVAAVVPVGALLAFSRLSVPPLVAEGAERVSVRRLLASPFFLAALVAMLLAGATEMGMAAWLPSYAERNLHFTKAVGAAALSGFLASMWLGRVLGAVLGHHMSPRGILRISSIIATVGYLAAVLLPWEWASLVACIATGLAVGGLWPTTLGLASGRIPHGGATMFVLLAAAGNGGCFLAPWIIGVIANTSGLNRGILYATLAPLALVLLIPVLTRLRAPAE